MNGEKTVPRFRRPTVRGEGVVILGSKPEGFTGLGHRDGDILVRYPNGEKGCVNLEDIEEGESPRSVPRTWIEPT